MEGTISRLEAINLLMDIGFLEHEAKEILDEPSVERRRAIHSRVLKRLKEAKP